MTVEVMCATSDDINSCSVELMLITAGGEIVCRR